MKDFHRQDETYERLLVLRLAVFFFAVLTAAVSDPALVLRIEATNLLPAFFVSFMYLVPQLLID